MSSKLKLKIEFSGWTSFCKKTKEGYKRSKENTFKLLKTIVCHLRRKKGSGQLSRAHGHQLDSESDCPVSAQWIYYWPKYLRLLPLPLSLFRVAPKTRFSAKNTRLSTVPRRAQTSLEPHPSTVPRGTQTGLKPHPSTVPRGTQTGLKPHPSTVPRGTQTGLKPHPSTVPCRTKASFIPIRSFYDPLENLSWGTYGNLIC